MKFFVLIALIGATFSLCAQSIKEQIEEIQKSSGEKRVELVNKLKSQIAELNQAQREEAIEQLKENKVRNQFDRENHKMQKNMGRKNAQEGTNGASQQRGRR